MTLDLGTFFASLIRASGNGIHEQRAPAAQGELQGDGGFDRTLLAASTERPAPTKTGYNEPDAETETATLFGSRSGVISTAASVLFESMRDAFANEAREHGEEAATGESIDPASLPAQPPTLPPQQTAAPISPVIAPTQVSTGAPRVNPASTSDLPIVDLSSPAVESAGAPQSPERASRPPLKEIDAGDIAIRPPEQLRVTAIETHLPAAIVHEATAMRALENSDTPEGPHRMTSALLHERGVDPVRLLKFELEPPALGAIAVKMRMLQGRVEIQIDVQSAVTLTQLDDMREKIAGTVAASGCAVETLEIRLAPSLAADMGQPHLQDGKSAHSQHAQSQGQEYPDGEGFQDRRQPPSRAQKHLAPSGDSERGSGVGGVYL